MNTPYNPDRNPGLDNVYEEVVDDLGVVVIGGTLGNRDFSAACGIVEAASLFLLAPRPETAQGVQPQTVMGAHVASLMGGQGIDRSTVSVSEAHSCFDAEPQFARSLKEIEQSKTSSQRSSIVMTDGGEPVAFGKHRGDPDRWLAIRESENLGIMPGLIFEHEIGPEELEKKSLEINEKGLRVVEVGELGRPLVMRTTLFCFGPDERGLANYRPAHRRIRKHAASALSMSVTDVAERVTGIHQKATS